MKKLHEFDLVYDSQKLFRRILEAVANPGRVVDMEEIMKKLPGKSPGLLAIAMTLLDNEVSFSTCENPELSEFILSLTLAREEELKSADYIFVTGEDIHDAGQVVEKAKCGTLRDPHQSATLIFEVVNLSGQHGTKIQGPGIDGVLEVYLNEYMNRILDFRDAMVHEYPCGVDLLFVSREGKLLAMPRKVVKEGVKPWHM